MRDDVAFVRNHFPRARASTVGTMIRVGMNDGRYIGWGQTERAAWEAAARFIRESQTAQIESVD